MKRSLWLLLPPRIRSKRDKADVVICFVEFVICAARGEFAFFPSWDFITCTAYLALRKLGIGNLL